MSVRNQLGRLYTAETTFQLGDRVVKPDVAFVSTDRLPENREKGGPYRRTSQLKSSRRQINTTMLPKKR